MVDPTTFFLFLTATFALFLSPGPNMAFVLAHGIALGRAGGIAAAFGIAVADLVLTVLTATGVTALVSAWPSSFDVLRLLGALYLGWFAMRTMLRPGGLPASGLQHRSLRGVFVRAMLNCLLNPKALLFFMVFLPQFVDPGRGHVALQLGILGCILSVNGLLFNFVLSVFSGRVSALLLRDGRPAMWQQRALGGLFLLLAVRLLLLEQPQSAN